MDEAPFIAEEERMMRQYRKAAASAEKLQRAFDPASKILIFTTVSALGILVGTYLASYLPDFETTKIETARHAAWMRECVPTQPEKRCDEIWRWVKR